MELVKIRENTETQCIINTNEGALVSHKNKLNNVIKMLRVYITLVHIYVYICMGEILVKNI